LPAPEQRTGGRPNGLALGPGNSLIGGAGDGFLLGGYGDAVSQLFSHNFPDYGIGLQLTIPLRNRTARADVVRDQLSVREQQIRLQQLEKQVRLDVTNALIAVEHARQSYEAAQSERVLQEQILSAEREKLEVGASTSFYVVHTSATAGANPPKFPHRLNQKAKTALQRRLERSRKIIPSMMTRCAARSAVMVEEM
jgi:hypothetical protein